MTLSLFRAIIGSSASLLFVCLASPCSSQDQVTLAKLKGTEPVLQPAIPAVLAAFDRYEIVGMSEAHGLKDEDDFILSLIRTPAFIEKVHDIAVECGNSLYQPVLDRYIAGEDVPFSEVQRVWRNTTQPMCGTSGFFELFFPLVRAINKRVPAESRIRVIACDPPIDWTQVKSPQDLGNYDRNQTIAAIVEREILAKHRKALILFGLFHLTHESTFDSTSAVELFEKQYPHSTFVIAGLEGLDFGTSLLSSNPFATWPVPALMESKGTWLGALQLSHFFPPPVMVKNCKATNAYPDGQDKPMERLVDAFLYLGPPELALREPMSADIPLDSAFMSELALRAKAVGGPWGETDFGWVTKASENPLLDFPKPASNEQLRAMEAQCREMMNHIHKSP
jgi:hypothetical protein